MNKIKISTIIFIVSVLFLGQALFSNYDKGGISNFTSYFIKPVGRTFSIIGWWFKDRINFLTSIGELKIDNQELFDENLDLKSRIARLSEVEKENSVLRNEISLAPRQKYNLEMATIIGKESGGYSEVVYADKGSRDGIAKGMAVLVGKGVLIGRVVEATVNTAKIQLITDKNFRVNSKLIESDGHGIVFGQYGTSIKMKMIPQTIEVHKGDTVVTSRLSDNFKPDLLIGYVQEVFDTADGLFQEATVLLPKDIESLYLVQILKE